MKSTRIVPLDELPTPLKERVMKCAKGRYQRALLHGVANWHGLGFTGKAYQWASRYAESRYALFERIKEATVGYNPHIISMPAHPRAGRGFTTQLVFEEV